MCNPGIGLALSIVEFLSKKLGDNQCAVKVMGESLLTSVLQIPEVQLTHLGSKIFSFTLDSIQEWI